MKLTAFEYKEPPGLKELSDKANELTGELMLHLHNAESDCLKSVLSEFLHREPTIEDAKRCTKIGYWQFENPNDYFLMYDRIILGTVTWNFNPMNAGMEFNFKKGGFTDEDWTTIEGLINDGTINSF